MIRTGLTKIDPKQNDGEEGWSYGGAFGSVRLVFNVGVTDAPNTLKHVVVVRKPHMEDSGAVVVDVDPEEIPELDDSNREQINNFLLTIYMREFSK